MYDVKLNLSHFPAQSDAEVLNITVGDLLRKTAGSHPDAVAMVDIADNGDCGQSWTYGELLEQAEYHALVMTNHSGHLINPGKILLRE